MGLGDRPVTQTAANEGPGDPVTPGGLGSRPVDSSKYQGKTNMGEMTNFPIQEYAPWSPNGVDSRGNADLIRAQNQGFLESSAKRLGNLIPNIAGTFIEGLGYLGSLATEWGDDRDYNNSLTQFGNSMKNPFGQVFRKHPNETWDLSDPAWWGDAAFSLIESAAAFGLEGGALGIALNGTLDLAKAAGMTGRALRAGRALTTLATSATLAYTEGAQIGAQVFQDTYKSQLQKGLDQGQDYETSKQQARHLASQAAATTVQLNTLINTALNVPEVAAIFKGDDEIMHWFKTEGQRGANETFTAWKDRIKATVPESADIQKLINPRGAALLTHLGTTAASEGIEEINNDWAEQRGRDEAKSGKPYANLGEMLGSFGDWFDQAFSSKGALNFVLGAAGGIAHPLILDHIPMHKVTTDAEGNAVEHDFEGEATEDGKYKTQYISSHQQTHTGHRRYFENIKDQVVGDFDRIEQIQNDITKAVATGDKMGAARLRQHLFDVGALNSVQLGLGKSFAAQFEDVRDLDNETPLSQKFEPQIQQLNQAIASEDDPVKKVELQNQLTELGKQAAAVANVTEAMQKGYATSMEDNNYKTKASQAIKDIDDYSKLWEDIHNKYSTGDDWHSRYADYLFGKEIEVRSRQRIISDEQKRITEMEARRAQALHPEEDPLTVQTIADIGTDNDSREELDKEEARVRRSLATLVTGKEEDRPAARKHLQELAEKYGALGVSDDDVIPAAHEIMGHIRAKSQGLQARLMEQVDAIAGTTQFEKWKEKNPGKDVADYVAAQRRKTDVDNGISQRKQELRAFEDQTDIAHKFLSKLRSRSGRLKYIEQAKALHNAMAKQMADKIKVGNAEAINQAYDKTSAKAMSGFQAKEYRKMLTEKLAALQQQVAETRQDIASREEEIRQEESKGFLKRSWGYLHESKKFLELAKARLESQLEAIRNLQDRVDQLEASPAEEAPLPAAQPNDVVLEGSSDDDVAKWLGSPMVYEDLLDQIWAIKTKGTKAEMVDTAMQLVETTLGGIDHAIAYQDAETQKKSIPHLMEFVEKKLREAGKIVDEKAATTVDPKIALVNTIKSFVQDGDTQAEILAVLASNEGNPSDNVLEPFVKNKTITSDQAAAIMQAFAPIRNEAKLVPSVGTTTEGQGTKESRRQAELYDLLSPEDKELADSIEDPEKKARWIKNNGGRTAAVVEKGKIIKPAGNDVLERHAAEDALDNPKSTMGERIAAMRNLRGQGPYNPAMVSTIDRMLQYVTEPKTQVGLGVFEREVLNDYNALMANQANTTELNGDLNHDIQASPKDDLAIEQTLSDNPGAVTALSTSDLDDDDAPVTLPDLGKPDSNSGQSMNFVPNLTIVDDSQGPNSGYHAGAKVVDAVKANVLTHEYFDNEEKVDGKTVFTKTQRFSLNPKLNQDYLRPGYIVPGTQLMLVVDEDWDGTVNDDTHYKYGGPGQVADSFDKYVTDGKITSHENVPIKVVDPRTGKTLAYLPRLDWVKASYEGAGGDYRNVADVISDGEGGVKEGNVDTQVQRLGTLRQKIVAAYNRGMKSGLKTTVDSRSRGIPLRVEPTKASLMLTDGSLKLAMGNGTTAFTEAQVSEENVQFPSYLRTDDRYNRVPGVLLPDASGRLNFEPLWTNKLDKGHIDTVVRALEVYMGLDDKVPTAIREKAQQDADAIEKATGFDISTAKGLESFINQYYFYSSTIDEADIKANTTVLGDKSKKPEFRINIGKNPMSGGTRSRIRAGITYTGRLAEATIDAKGNLAEAFKKLLYDQSAGMASRFRNIVFTNPSIGIKGINSKGPINEVTWRPESRDFVTKTHASYNDLVKENSMTTMYGQLQTKDGTYVYYAHPVTTFNREVTMAQEIVPERKQVTTVVATKVEKGPVMDNSDLDDLDDAMTIGFKPELNIVNDSTIGNVPGKPTSLESLAELRNFTPAQNLNDRSVLDVYKELSDLGIHNLPEGFNPFFRC